jgi:hypothetical protein
MGTRQIRSGPPAARQAPLCREPRQTARRPAQVSSGSHPGQIPNQTPEKIFVNHRGRLPVPSHAHPEEHPDPPLDLQDHAPRPHFAPPSAV